MPHLTASAIFWLCVVAPGTAVAQSALDQLKVYEQGKSAKPTPEQLTAQAARAAAKTPALDIVGIRLGMPAKEALAALKAHNPSLQPRPESIKYEFLPDALTYGIHARSPKDNGREISDLERIYLLLTLAPNQQVVTKVVRWVSFGKASAPRTQVLLADLIRKYGPVSFDGGEDKLNGGGWDLTWAFDAQGNRAKIDRETNQGCGLNNLALSFGSSETGWDLPQIQIQSDPRSLRDKIERNFDAYGAESARACAAYTMIRVRVFGLRYLHDMTPGLVGGFVAVMGNGPLFASAADATREYLHRTAAEFEEKKRNDATKNRAKL